MRPATPWGGQPPDAMKLPDPLATAYGATLALMRLAQMLAATGVGATLFLSEERWAEFTYERRRAT